MKIYLVCSTADNWIRGGYGASLIAAKADRTLVSFVEFLKNPKQTFVVDGVPDPYVPKLQEAAPEDPA